MSASDERRKALEADLAVLRESLPTITPGIPVDREVQFSKELAAQILDFHVLGHSLHKISQMPSMPCYGTLQRWAKEHPYFREALQAVRQFRALHMEGLALDVAEEAGDVAERRLRFDIFKWGCEVNDPSRYGKKVTHGGDPDNPIKVVVATGFPEPNEFQRPPVLNADGTIERAKPVEAEVAEVPDEPALSPEEHSPREL